MDRVEMINNFTKAKIEKEYQEQLAKEQRIANYIATIKTLKPRMKELIKVGNACKRNNIPLTCKSWSGHEGYDTHQFLTNSWSHLLGFVSAGDNDFDSLGIFGGGACDYQLVVKVGKDVEVSVSGRREGILQRFLKEFDDFETSFYAYVDKVCQNN